MHTFNGLAIVVAPDKPRMVLPAELVPGVVPWPPGFKADMDAWMLAFFGTWNLLVDGEVMVLEGKTVTMNPRTFEQFKAAVAQANRPNVGGNRLAPTQEQR